MPAIKIQWKTGVGAHSYQVWRGTTADSGAASILAGSVEGNTYLDDTAVEGTTYYYWIRSINAAGVSGFSAGTGPLTPGRTLPPPAEVEASLVLDGEILVVWAAVAGATKYDVWRHTAEDFSAATKVGDNVAALEHTHTPPAHDAAYFFWVVAKDDAGHASLPSLATVGVALVPVPAAPTGVNATEGLANKIRIAWTAATHATGYEIWRHTSNASGSATKIATVGAVTSYDHFPGGATNYYFWVKARNYRGTSAFSDPDTGHAYIPPPPPPAAPANCVATNDEEGQITITADTVSGAYSYKVYRNTVLNPATATLIADDLLFPTYVDTSMALETAYYYWVSAFHLAGGEGDKSNADDGFALTPAIPAAPTGVSATEGLTDKTTVTWSASSGAASYSVWRSPTSSSGDAVQIASGLTALAYDDETGDHEVSYHYFVKATNAGGTSGFSSGDSGYRVLSIPAAPTGVNATDGLNDKTTVTWSASSGAASYSVWRDGVQIASGVTALTYDDETGLSGQAYDYTVKATNAAGTSAASSANSGFRYVSICDLSISGGDAGHDRYYYRASFTTLHISFNAQSQKDRLKVWFDLTLVYDSGCVAGIHTADVTNGGANGGVRVEVIGNCEGGTGTAWSADFTCS